MFSNIPEEHVKGFISLYSISDQNFAKLLNALVKTEICQDIEDLVSAISIRLKLESGLVEDILLAVSSLYSVKDRYDLKPKAITQSVHELLKVNKKIKYKPETGKKFEDRLEKLIDSEQLYVSYKIYILYIDHKNLYISSKILTDIRPVFTKPNINPKASIVANTLHIHYRTGDQDIPHKDFVIALDTKDLQDLKRAITRAEQKNETLKRMIKSAGMKYVDPSEEN